MCVLSDVFPLETVEQAGRYEGKLTVHVMLRQHPKAWHWRWPGYGPFPKCLLPFRSYSGKIIVPSPPSGTIICSYTVSMPFYVNVTDAANAPVIAARRGHDIDRAMKEAIGFGTVEHNCLEVHFTDPPENAAFKVIFREDNGREYSHPGVYILNKQEESETRFIRLRDLVRQPGSYSGTVILKGDADAVYDDVDMDSFWDGTLETPVIFVIQK